MEVATRHQRYTSGLSDEQRVARREASRRSMHRLRAQRRQQQVDGGQAEAHGAPGHARNVGMRDRRRSHGVERHAEWWNYITSVHLARHTARWRERCRSCGARLLASERKTYCCANGKKRIAPLRPLPTSIQTLITKARSKFGPLSRQLNRLFCLAVIGASHQPGFGPHTTSGGPPFLTLSGRSFHVVRPTKEKGHPIRWMLYDQAEHVSQYSSVPAMWKLLFRQALLRHNRIYRQLEKFRKRLVEGEDTVALRIHLPKQPESNEVAAVVCASNTALLQPRAFYIFDEHHRQTPRDLSPTDAIYEPVSYPILFSRADKGWHSGFCSTEGQEIKMQEYYKARILSEEARLAQFSRLSFEYLLDGFSRCQDVRLAFIAKGQRRQQRQVREWEEDQVDNGDAGFNDDRTPHSELPASYLGSKAWASAQVADALALARNGRGPTLFITATCNPNWEEIVNHPDRQPGEQVNDRPSVICRAFHARLNKLMAHLRTSFGEVAYIVRVVEFQKRGLPHAHIVIRCEPQLHLQHIDKVVSAEVPGEGEPELRAAVLQHMIHPQDHLDPGRYSRCRRDNGSCQWGYPQPVRPRTTIDDFGTPLYRRRKPEDSMVVPFCPALLLFWEGHMNVEVVSTAHVFLYLYKYVWKGPDRTRVAITSTDELPDEVDAVKSHLSARYVSHIEATWRLLGLDISRREPAVIRLAVHLPERNVTQYGSNGSTSSSLLKYLSRPADPLFDALTYVQYNEQFTFKAWDGDPITNDAWLEQPTGDGAVRVVCRRVQNRGRPPVARLHSVPFSEGETFHLRAIMQHLPARHWEDWKVVHGVRHGTYAEASKALGLFDDQNEAETAIIEAMTLNADGPQLRFLFALLIVEVEDSIPVPLWERFSADLASDYLRLDLPHELALDRTLHDLADLLAANGHCLSKFGLPEPSQANLTAVMMEYRAFGRVRGALREHVAEMLAQMQPEQRAHYNTVLAALAGEEPEGRAFFLSGRAGRGKSFVSTTLAHWLRSEGKIVLIAGATALSVCAYPRGRTMHNLFHLPVNKDNIDIKSRLIGKRNHADSILILHATLIILEELPMANVATLEAIDDLLRRLTGFDIPFGGKLILGIGDFRQVAPVVPGAYSADPVIAASVCSSYLWSEFKILLLDAPIRYGGDAGFADWVDEVGDGLGSGDGEGVDPAPMVCRIQSIEEAVAFVFPSGILSNSVACLARAFLSPLNVLVDAFNDHILHELPGPVRLYLSHDEIHEADNHTVSRHDSDFLTHLTERGVPPHRLELKTGVVCSIMRNLDISKGLVKNARVRIVGLHRNIVQVALLQPSFDPTSTQSISESVHCIPRIRFQFQPNKHPFTVKRKQFPFRLAYACTFNSCQGLTLDRAVIDGRKEVFAHGQLYTALSRVRTRDALNVLLPDGSEDGASTRLTNVVYRDLLL